MKIGKLGVVLILGGIFPSLLFAQEETYREDMNEETYIEEPYEEGQAEIPQSLLNNRYYLQSVRFTEQAREAFEIGDYDLSARHAEQAAEYARLSDEYVVMRLAENTFAKAHSRYTWAGSVGAGRRYPAEYQRAETAYNQALEARRQEDWDALTVTSNEVIAALANVTGQGGQTGPAVTEPPRRPAQGALPSQYTVRRWSSTGDCFSTIAGWSWVYGDPFQWRVLYEANRDKLPSPENPHLIVPGMVLDIPSLKGEARSGMWDPEAEYNR
ncbi:MAG: LysM peptidoglycan-binding domain-containing protein [Spirochaetaceae bacterium]|jgi:nucleoid-associated protein YgaU|nr:LysM peptidoglycan-binding domain-containing protein [Spirochaetaceae bacterium]